MTAANSVNAQIAQGVKTVSANTTGIEFFTGDENSIFNIGLQGDVFIVNNFSIGAGVSLLLQSQKERYEETISSTVISLEIGADYYFHKNLFIGLRWGAIKPDKNAMQGVVQLELGYMAYFTETVFFRPKVYYQEGFSNQVSEGFGLSIGIGANF